MKATTRPSSRRHPPYKAQVLVVPERLLDCAALVPAVFVGAAVVGPTPFPLHGPTFVQVFRGDGLIAPVLLPEPVDEVPLGVELFPGQGAELFPAVNIVGVVPVRGDFRPAAEQGLQSGLVLRRDPLHPEGAALLPAPVQELFHRLLQIAGAHGAQEGVAPLHAGADEQHAVLHADCKVEDVPPDIEVCKGILVAGVVFPPEKLCQLPFVAEGDRSELQHGIVLFRLRHPAKPGFFR